MEEDQSFRLIETMDTVKITLSHVGGQNIVHWEDIEQAFPGVKRVYNGNSVITFIRTSSQESLNRGQHSVLDVVLSTAVKNDQAGSPLSSSNPRPTDTLADAPAKDKDVEDLRVIPSTAELLHDDANACTVPTAPLLSRSSPSSSVNATSFKGARFQDVVKKAQKFEIEQGFVSSLAPDIQEKVRASPNIYQAFAEAIKVGQAADSPVELSQQLHLLQSSLDKNTELTAQGLKAQEEMRILQQQLSAKQEETIRLEKKVLENQEEMKQLQVKALEQLAVLQSRVQAVLTQTYELHEFPIPRLFVVLPQYPSGWDILEPFTDKYRLYFLCECGDHTKKPGSNNNISHKIHFAKHKGYEIARPTEFFQHYGPYVLTILKMLMFGVSVASVAVPAVAHLINADALDQAAKGLQQLKDCIEPGMNQLICKIEKDSVDEGETVESFTGQMENKETLEGADLRKLETFLKDKDGNKVLGNLYRTVTDEGHVKWVCMDHYRENYNQVAVEAFRRTVDSLRGSFDENNGVVMVKLQSRVSANQLYLALGNSKSVHELDIVFAWACIEADVLALENALRKSTVAILHVDLQLFRPSLNNQLLSISTRYEVLHRLMNPLNMKSIHIILPKDLALSNFTPKKPPHLRKLSFEIVLTSELRIHAETVECGSPVATLYLQESSFGLSGGQALSEALKTNSTLTTLDLKGNKIGSNGAQALSEALKTNSTLTTLYMGGNSIGSNGAQALSEALKTNSTLTRLKLMHNSIGDNGAQALSEALKTNSTLTTLNFYGNSIGSNGAQALSEALKTNSTLTTLGFGGNKIGDNGARALSEALKTNSTLTALNLSYNSIGDNVAQALSDALKTNSTLTTLDLEGNKIGDNGAQALSEALKTNLTLTTLFMGGNRIGSNGAQALSEALKINSTLTTLNLSYNSIGDKGAQALSHALKTNSTLTTMDLYGNSIGDNEAQALSKALKTNSTLTTLDLEGNKIGVNGAQSLSEALKTNSTITTLGLDTAQL